MTTSFPPAFDRLFSEICPMGELDYERHGDFIIGRLLEDGDGADLTWLTEHLSESRLREWVEARGRRQLSRRSWAFWSRLLEPEDGCRERRSADEGALWNL